MMANTHLLLDLYETCLAGITDHPQKIMQDLGITYLYATPQSMFDAWQFWICDGVPDELPSYLRKITADPMKFVGYGLSRETAEAIHDFDYSKMSPKVLTLHNKLTTIKNRLAATLSTDPDKLAEAFKGTVTGEGKAINWGFKVSE